MKVQISHALLSFDDSFLIVSEVHGVVVIADLAGRQERMNVYLW